MSNLKHLEDKKLDQDLWIIGIISMVVLSVFMLFQDLLFKIVETRSIPVLSRVFIMAIFQYGLAGLGITIVSIIRKENFIDHGLRFQGIFTAIVLSSLCFIPNIIFQLITKQTTNYFPFQSVLTTKEVLISGFPTNIIGMAITAIIWGFFEGFNYVVISDKINKRYPSNKTWLNYGAIVCAIMCILIHGAVSFKLEGFIEMSTILIIIYGILMVKEFTGNAWGCVFVFLFLWNAY